MMSGRSEELKQPATSNPESVSMKPVSVVLLGAPEWRRTLVSVLTGTQARVVNEGALPHRDKLPSLIDAECDVLIVDLDQDAERGLEVVEAACGINGQITVMVYSRKADPELLVRCMRVGAREFLTDVVSPSSITEAMIRASVRREELRTEKNPLGKLLVFTGAKGGAGVTTVACNFAITLAKETGQSVGLLDLNVRLGDAALNLGVTPEFSVLDALMNEHRMDSELVKRLLVRHSSGVQLLAAPDAYSTFTPTTSAVLKLVEILQRQFPYLLVDLGTHYDGYGLNLFQAADTVYLVTQVSVVDLRNAHRFISANFAGAAAGKLEVILNRYTARAGEIDDESIRKALTLTAKWRIPSDFQTVRHAQNTATAVAGKDGPITRVVTAMARTACGKTEEAKRKRFGLF